MTDINYSYSLGTQPSQTVESETLWSCHGVEIIPVSASAVVLFNPKNDARLLVQPEVARALEQCFHFNSLSEHLNRLFEAMPPLREQPENALQTLELVRDAGIFESADEAWERLTAGASNGPPLDGDTVRLFILTCDRPVALQRLLNALQDQILPQQIEALYVIDDSRLKDNTVDNARAIKTAQTRLHVPIRHIDMGARTALISHLKASLPEGSHASIDFLLARSSWAQAPTYGLARNLALLLSVNYRALILDDDILPYAVKPPLASRDLTFDTPNSREAIFYPSTEDMERHVLMGDDGPFTAMLKSLGQSLGQVLSANLNGPNALKGVDGRLTTQFGAASRVHLSQCGTWGDPGTVDSGWVFFQPTTSIKRLLNSGSEPKKLLAAQATWIGYRGATIGAYGTISQLTGLNHGALLPPYLPAGRGEDMLFAIMLQRLHPESAVYNEGWAVPHHPVEDRATRGQLLPLTVNASIGTLIDWLGRPPRDEAGISPEKRLLMLADEISRLSEMTPKALEGIAQRALLGNRSSLLSRCMNHLNALTTLGDLPGIPRWQDFLEQSRDNLLNQIQSEEPHPVADAMTHATFNIESLREKGSDFAEAMRVWPAICKAAEAFELR